MVVIDPTSLLGSDSTPHQPSPGNKQVSQVVEPTMMTIPSTHARREFRRPRGMTKGFHLFFRSTKKPSTGSCIRGDSTDKLSACPTFPTMQRVEPSLCNVCVTSLTLCKQGRGDKGMGEGRGRKGDRWGWRSVDVVTSRAPFAPAAPPLLASLKHTHRRTTARHRVCTVGFAKRMDVRGCVRRFILIFPSTAGEASVAAIFLHRVRNGLARA